MGNADEKNGDEWFRVIGHNSVILQVRSSRFCMEGSILVSRSLSIMWRIFFSYILFKRFYLGDKISLNHMADFLQLHPLQKVLFWWQDLSQSCGGFSSATSSSKGFILVTRYLSIMWRIFFSYILFKRFYFGDKISLIIF